MPKVCKHYVKINGQQKVGEIHYTASSKMFHFNFPAEIVDWGRVKYPEGRHLVTAASQAELETEILKLIKEYEAEAMKERKLLVYQISHKSTRQELQEDLDEAEDDDDRQRAREKHTGDDQEIEIKLEFNVVIERAVGNNVLLFKQKIDWRTQKPVLEPCSTWGYEDWKRIEWSESTEKFFNDVYSGMETLISRLDKFAGTPERVKKAITNSSRLLEAPKK